MKKKFCGFVLFLLLILVEACSLAWAVELRYNENDQQWRDLEVQQVPWRSGTDLDNDYYGTNCFALIKWIVEIEGRGTINSYTNYGRVLDNYTGGQLVAQYLNDQKNAYPTAETVRADFSKAHLGDVVQMRWKYSKSTQHTAMINGFDNNGVYFFQSHVSGTNVMKIKNSYYSYADLAQRYSNAGSQGGYSIYYFAAPVGDDTSARDKVVAYAEKIYNYVWKTDKDIRRRGLGGVNAGSVTGNIKGVPYTFSNMLSFAEYDLLPLSSKEEMSSNGYEMNYGMVCATFVTDCIMQGFPAEAKLHLDNGTMFHQRGNYGQYISSVAVETTYASYNNEDLWPSIWDKISSAQKNSGYPAYQKLKKADYLNNYDHVRLVIENDTNTQTVYYIDQTPCWDSVSAGMVGTHRGSATYDELSRSHYIPMYVNYPGDSAPEPEGVPIDSANFPDKYFREYVKNFDTNGDGYFSQSELDAVTEMWEENGPHPDNGNPNNGNYGYEWIKIESIEGIKLFRNLKSLCVYRDNIKEIDLSGMEHLERLYCYGNENDEGYGNRLTKLNLKNCSSLQELRCQNNQIKTLDLSGMEKLTSLWCWNNKIETLNLKGCKSLPELWAHYNKLTSLNVDGCTNLKKAYLWNNSFTGFGQGSNYMPALEVLNLAGCSSMTGLNLTYYKNLKELHINDCSSLEWVDTSYSPNIANTVNTSGCNSLKTFDREPNVKVTGTAPTITTTSLPDAYVGKSYSATVSTSGTGSSNGRIFFWIDKGDAYSNGFGLMRNYTGLLKGTPKQESSSLKITVRASNYVGETSKTFTIKVINGDKPEITTLSISEEAEVGEWFSETIEAESSEAVTWSISNGELPPGLSLDSSTGEIRGRPESVEETRTGSGKKAYFFMVRATNTAGYDEEAYHLTIVEPFKIVTSSLPNARVGVAYTAEIYGEGGYIHESAMDYMTWHADDLPEGLKLTSCHTYDSQNKRYVRKAIISGTPTISGTFRFGVDVRDVSGWLLDDRDFTITVNAAPKPLALEDTFKNGIRGTYYSGYVTASGGISPYTWSYTGTLPAGLEFTFSGANATLSGIPTKAGTFTFAVKVTDQKGQSLTKSFTIKVTQTTVTGNIPATVARGTSVTWTLKASGGTASYKWSISKGKLPDGLKINASNGKITGKPKPTKAGTFTFTFTVKAVDKNGIAGTKSYSVKVTQTTVTGNIPATVARGVSVTWTLKASGGTASYKWSISKGKLPDGLKINASNGKITGKPTKAGTFTFTVKAVDKNNIAGTKSYSTKVTQTTVTGNIPATVARGTSVTWTHKASGGTASYKWSISKGKLPDGLKINASNGKITGKPTKAGTFTFTVKAADKNNIAATKSYSVKVTQTTITGNIPTTVARGVSVTWTHKASGGTASYKWSISKGKLPNGLKINASNGKITGKPTKAGTFNFTVKATDKNNISATKSYTVKVTEVKTSNETKSDNESSPEPETKTEQKQDTKSSPEDKSTLPEALPDLPANGENAVTLSADLKVVSDDIVESYDGRDSDLVKVHADKPLRFIVGNWGAEISSAVVYIDNKPLNGITVSDEGLFILPAEIVSGDFKVGVKAHSEAGELESSELYIITE